MGDHYTALHSLVVTYAVERRKVKLASGRESDFFIDCKRVLLTAAGAYHAGILMRSAIRCTFHDVQGVAGVALGGCPLATAVSLATVKAQHAAWPAFYVRKVAKDHGTKQLVEGEKPNGKRVVLLEDVVTTGGSSLDAIRSMTDVGMKVLGVVALVDRQEGAAEAFAQAGVRMFSIFTRADLMNGK